MRRLGALFHVRVLQRSSDFKGNIRRRAILALTGVNSTVGIGRDGARAGSRGRQVASWRLCHFWKGSPMADINIVQQHSLGTAEARAAAQKVADKLAAEYGLECRWDGDTLRFERSGVEGALALEDRQAALNIKLGFFASAFAPAIESKVSESMRRVFGAV
jgi:putative polyhydroxyalkanoate system protein